MNQYNEQDYWRARYAAGGHSGSGSRGIEAVWKQALVLKYARRAKVQSIMDFGCGDGVVARGFLKELPGVTYTGLDIVPFSVPSTEERKLLTIDLAGEEPPDLGTADMVLCLDVLFHCRSQERHDRLLRRVVEATRKVALIGTLVREPSPPVSHVLLWEMNWPLHGFSVQTMVVPADPSKVLYLLKR